MSSARDLGEAAGEACAAAAERRTGFSRDAAAEVILQTLEAAPGPVSGEVLTNACVASGIVPHDDRAFGPVFSQLARQGHIETTGYASRSKGHGTAGARLWRRVMRATLAPVTLRHHPISRYLAHGETAELRALALEVVVNCPGCGAVTHPFSLDGGDGRLLRQEVCEKCAGATA